MSAALRQANALLRNGINGGAVRGNRIISNSTDLLQTKVSLDFRVDSFNEATNFPSIFGADGTVTQNASGVTINSVPFTFTIPTGNEHVKWLKFYKDTFIVPDRGEVIYEARVAVSQTFGTIPAEYLPRMRTQTEDIRICAGAINCIDVTTWMVFDFLIANDAIYAFYERLPFGKPGFVTPQPFPKLPEDYSAFSSCKLVARRASTDPENDFVTLAIAVRRHSVRWLVNGQEVWRIPRLGFKPNDEFMILNHGGPQRDVEVGSIQCGFGTFSLLDMALPYNYARERTITDGGTSLENRNVSQLAQIDLTANYTELYNGFDGTDRALTTIAGEPDGTFAVDLATVQGAPATYKLFGNGSVIRVQTFKVYSRDRVNDADASSVSNSLQPLFI